MAVSSQNNCILPQLLPASICIMHSKPLCGTLERKPSLNFFTSNASIATKSQPLQPPSMLHDSCGTDQRRLRKRLRIHPRSATTSVSPPDSTKHLSAQARKPHYDRHLLPFSHASHAQPLTLLPLNANLPITPLPAPLACLNHILCPAMLHLTQLLTTPKPARSIICSGLTPPRPVSAPPQPSHYHPPAHHTPTP